MIPPLTNSASWIPVFEENNHNMAPKSAKRPRHFFPTKIFTHLSFACCMPHTRLLPWFDHHDNIWWQIQIMKLLNVNFLHARLTSSVMCLDILFRHPVLSCPQSISSGRCKRPIFLITVCLEVFVCLSVCVNVCELILYLSLTNSTCCHYN